MGWIFWILREWPFLTWHVKGLVEPLTYYSRTFLRLMISHSTWEITHTGFSNLASSFFFSTANNLAWYRPTGFTDCHTKDAQCHQRIVLVASHISTETLVNKTAVNENYYRHRWGEKLGFELAAWLMACLCCGSHCRIPVLFPGVCQLCAMLNTEFDISLCLV